MRLYHTKLDTPTPTPVRNPLNRDKTLTGATNYTTHNKQKRCTTMPLQEFEPAIPAIDQCQTSALECTATGISLYTVNEIFCRSDMTLVPAL